MSFSNDWDLLTDEESHSCNISSRRTTGCYLSIVVGLSLEITKFGDFKTPTNNIIVLDQIGPLIWQIS